MRYEVSTGAGVIQQAVRCAGACIIQHAAHGGIAGNGTVQHAVQGTCCTRCTLLVRGAGAVQHAVRSTCCTRCRRSGRTRRDTNTTTNLRRGIDCHVAYEPLAPAHLTPWSTSRRHRCIVRHGVRAAGASASYAMEYEPPPASRTAWSMRPAPASNCMEDEYEDGPGIVG